MGQYIDTLNADAPSLYSVSPGMGTAGLHARLTHFNETRLRPALPDDGGRSTVTTLADEMAARMLEETFLKAERAAVRTRAEEVPDDPAGFVAWFEALKESGPGQNDPLFPFLADHASMEQMKWYVLQEVAGEAGFDDLVALTQVKLPIQSKLELARNYWDEMGRGREIGMHGPMLHRLTVELQLDTAEADIVWESQAVANLLIGLASNRRYAYHSVGALGAIELTAPGRSEHVQRGLQRLGVSKEGRTYFALHATLDVKHSEAWNREVLTSLVAENPRTAQAMAEGALMRLRAGARCFERYRRAFGI